MAENGIQSFGSHDWYESPYEKGVNTRLREVKDGEVVAMKNKMWGRQSSFITTPALKLRTERGLREASLWRAEATFSSTDPVGNPKIRVHTCEQNLVFAKVGRYVLTCLHVPNDISKLIASRQRMELTDHSNPQYESFKLLQRFFPRNLTYLLLYDEIFRTNNVEYESRICASSLSEPDVKHWNY